MQTPSCDVVQALTILVSIVLTEVHGTENRCLLQESVVPINRQMQVMHNGGYVSASCSGAVTLKKCEGVCVSSVSPSVRRPSGYNKVCRCCRETGTHTRPVVLANCTNNGQVLSDVHPQISVIEMTGCDCQNCDD